jgi:hypothetical protein
VGDFPDHAGIRWFELRRSGGGNFVLSQEATYAPDASHRWNGSIGQDRDANIALGYSLSGNATFPSIDYVGRLATDPLGTLPQGETALIAGGGSQTASNRWGDYSSMTLDPVDDCTFWYTNEYYTVSSGTNWRTRIGAFKFPTCGAAPPTSTPTPTRTATQTSTVTSTPTATRTPAPPTPLTSGTPGVPCTTVVGSTCTAGSGVNGSWTKTGSGTFTFTATGPANSVVGGSLPTLFIPTTVNPAGEQFTCTTVGAQFTTTCTGTTVGDPLLGATVTIEFPLVGGGFAPLMGTIFGPAVNLPVPTVNPQLRSLISQNNRTVPPPLPLPPPPPALLPPPPAVLAPPAPRGPMAPPMAPGAPPEIPMIPEADSTFLVITGLAGIGALAALRARRRKMG